MPTAFEDKKSRIIKELEVPDSEYNDLSPKGSIDVGIRELLDEINTVPNLVTTSSCAGRLSVYVEGKTRPVDDANINESSTQIIPSSGGKGGGRWLFVSHDPIGEAASLRQVFGLKSKSEVNSHNLAKDAALIHLKFEAMILHLLTASLEDAATVLTAASGAGFRESGAMSLSANKDGSIMPMVAVRSNGLALDCVIGYVNEHEEPVCFVSEDYLQLLSSVINERFKVNSERIARFRQAVLAAYSSPDVSPNGKSTRSQYEDSGARRARKRAEGLARQAEHQPKEVISEDFHGDEALNFLG